YTCFLIEDEALPMMYMDDAVRAAIELMEAAPSRITERGSYNIAGVSFTPEQLAREIRQHVPQFQIHYEPDFREAIAMGWPDSIDDSLARRDWGWLPRYDLAGITRHMLQNLAKKNRRSYAA